MTKIEGTEEMERVRSVFTALLNKIYMLASPWLGTKWAVLLEVKTGEHVAAVTTLLQEAALDVMAKFIREVDCQNGHIDDKRSARGEKASIV